MRTTTNFGDVLLVTRAGSAGIYRFDKINGSYAAHCQMAALLIGLTIALVLIYRSGPSLGGAEVAVDHLGQRDSCASLARHVRPFFVYAANFGNFDATYGSLGAVIGFMTWMWISAIEVVYHHAPPSETATGAPAS